MPDAYDDKSEENYRAVVSKNVDQDLEYRLFDTAVDCPLEVLDREQQAKDEEPSKNGRRKDGDQDSQR